MVAEVRAAQVVAVVRAAVAVRVVDAVQVDAVRAVDAVQVDAAQVEVDFEAEDEEVVADAVFPEERSLVSRQRRRITSITRTTACCVISSPSAVRSCPNGLRGTAQNISVC